MVEQAKHGNGKAVASLVLGVIGIFVFVSPPAGLIVNGIGLFLGLKARKQNRENGIATAGTAVSAIGLMLTVLVVILFLCLAATGQNLFQR